MEDKQILSPADVGSLDNLVPGSNRTAAGPVEPAASGQTNTSPADRATAAKEGAAVVGASPAAVGLVGDAVHKVTVLLDAHGNIAVNGTVRGEVLPWFLRLVATQLEVGKPEPTEEDAALQANIVKEAERALEAVRRAERALELLEQKLGK